MQMTHILLISRIVTRFLAAAKKLRFGTYDSRSRHAQGSIPLATPLMPQGRIRRHHRKDKDELKEALRQLQRLLCYRNRGHHDAQSVYRYTD
jgi:hypothetical protein